MFCIAAAILAAMTSCGTTKYVPTEEDELTRIWAGKEYQDIVQSYGEPDRIEMDGMDGSILLYEEHATVIDSQTNTRDSVFVTQVPTTVTDRNHEREMYFFLNPEGYCYLVSTNRSVPGNDMEKNDLKEGLIGMGVMTGITLTATIISLICKTAFGDQDTEFEFY